eukprot:GEZU01036245.1.p2 GENE.GEZU01036245.1~~GEZU01036245.1.p2  ORF type:complete len:244 (-),score=74.72 GEZU01036245.1:395-1126(-)
MEYLSRQNNINWQAVFNFNDISAKTQNHLKTVYTTLLASVATSALGVYFQIETHFSTNLSFFLTFSLLMYVILSPSFGTHPKSRARLLGLLGFSFFEGASLGPLVEYTLFLDPRIVLIAFASTAVIFACFTGAALFAQRRSYLYLGGVCSSALSLMCFMGFVSFFINLPAMFFVQLYAGLLVFCAYVIYDTQLIVEKASAGDTNYINHTLELFVDFVAIFVRILIILADKERKKENDNNKRRR